MPETAQWKAGELAALRRFPAERPAIKELIARDGDFRDMCEELAEAEFALEAAELLPLAVRAERMAEWAAAIDRLAAEMLRALGEANVIRIGWASHPKKPP
jgi:hypothetical protein